MRVERWKANDVWTAHSRSFPRPNPDARASVDLTPNRGRCQCSGLFTSLPYIISTGAKAMLTCTTADEAWSVHQRYRSSTCWVLTLTIEFTQTLAAIQSLVAREGGAGAPPTLRWSFTCLHFCRQRCQAA